MAKPELYQQLAVHCDSHEYPIYIGCDLLADKALLSRQVLGSQVLIVSNDTVAPLYLKQLKQAFQHIQCDECVLPDGESYKSQESLTAIYDALIKLRHHRDTTLIALGGGVIGDITGFAAATYQRGVPFIQIPTTLLAQVDASIGGKTAINHPHGKNMIGCFYQPRAVIMDLNTLKTLPKREFHAGFAEIIKHALLVGGEFLHIIRALLVEEPCTIPLEALAEVIASSCRIKARFVEEDEREMGQRALLNLGHTFAHALEAYTQYQRWFHGEAVAIGLYCAALLSYQVAGLDVSTVTLIDSMLKAASLPRRIPKDIDINTLQEWMFQDKKIKNKTLRFVLMKAPGSCYLDSQVTHDCLRQVLINAVEGEKYEQ